jgi:CBS domain-containing protein
MPVQSVKQILENKGSVVHTLPPTATVYEAIAMMAEKYVGALAVVEDGKLVGILSERDYARKVILQGKSSKDTLVRDIMSSQVITTTLDSRANACMRVMTESRIRHLPVLDQNRLVGMLSIGDLLKVVIAEQQAHIDQLNHYIQS